MKKVLIVINFDEGLYNFRKELLEALLKAGYEVHIAVPDGAANSIRPRCAGGAPIPSRSFP